MTGLGPLASWSVIAAVAVLAWAIAPDVVALRRAVARALSRAAGRWATPTARTRR